VTFAMLRARARRWRSSRRFATTWPTPASTCGWRAAPKACSSWVLPVPARRCSPRPSPAKRMRRSSRSRVRLRGVPVALAQRASGICSARRAKRRRRSSSSTSLTRGRKRGAGIGQGNDEREQTLNQILVRWTLRRRRRLVVMGATNRPDILDPHCCARRFDRQVLWTILTSRQAGDPASARRQASAGTRRLRRGVARQTPASAARSSPTSSTSALLSVRDGRGSSIRPRSRRRSIASSQVPRNTTC